MIPYSYIELYKMTYNAINNLKKNNFAFSI